MKILHVIFSFTPDGAETMLVDIINSQFQTENVELIIINNQYNKELIQTISKNVRVHCLNRTPGSINPITLVCLNYKIYKLNPDIIHFHNHNAIALVKFKRQAKTILTIHGLFRPLTYLSKYNKLIAISDTVRKDLTARGSFNPTVVYNGIDFSRIPERKELFTDKIFKIVIVSRLCHEIKGQDIVLKALHNLIYHKNLLNLQLDLIGEGPSLPFLQDLANQLNLHPFVNFLGLKNRNSIYNALKNYSLLVQPSIHEGFGLTIVEGMAAKIPVLVSSIPGPMEVIKNGKYGYYFESKNWLSCADEIAKIIMNKHKIEFSENLNDAYDYAINNYSIQTTTSNYIKEYTKTNNF